jgi:hypothetical protein
MCNLDYLHAAREFLKFEPSYSCLHVGAAQFGYQVDKGLVYRTILEIFIKFYSIYNIYETSTTWMRDVNIQYSLLLNSALHRS